MTTASGTGAKPNKQRVIALDTLLLLACALPFQATAMRLPTLPELFAGATSTGRPVSNNAESRLAAIWPSAAASGRARTVRSTSRPAEASTTGSGPVSWRQVMVMPAFAAALS